MKQVITAKLKLHTEPDQFQALRATQLAYRDSLNHVSQYAYEHGKMSNAVGLQEGTYSEIRAKYKLPAQMACSVPRQVGATYKTLWTKTKQNTVQRKAGITRKRYKGLDNPPKYISPTLTYQYGKDYSFKKEQHVSILTLEGRVILPYTGYDKHVALIGKGAQIGLEHLTDIRERTERRKSKKATTKQRKANGARSRWAFAELHSMLAYKALQHGSMAIKVDANYTSQACPMCGYTCKKNRPNKGLVFVCQSCQYTLHADLVGARNIALRTLLIRQDWIGTGVLSVSPDVSDSEAKAARLRRYAELRWSPDTSPCRRDGGN